MAQTENEVTVYLQGRAVVTVHVEDDVTDAKGALIAAAAKLGVEGFNPDQLSVIKNGEQVKLDSRVRAGDQLATATGVANG